MHKKRFHLCRVGKQCSPHHWWMGFTDYLKAEVPHFHERDWFWKISSLSNSWFGLSRDIPGKNQKCGESSRPRPQNQCPTAYQDDLFVSQFCGQPGRSSEDRWLNLNLLHFCPGWTETLVLGITAANTTALHMQSDPANHQHALSCDQLSSGNSWIDCAKRSPRFDESSLL